MSKMNVLTLTQCGFDAETMFLARLGKLHRYETFNFVYLIAAKSWLSVCDFSSASSALQAYFSRSKSFVFLRR